MRPIESKRAFLDDGSAKCWVYSYCGQLGNAVRSVAAMGVILMVAACGDQGIRTAGDHEEADSIGEIGHAQVGDACTKNAHCNDGNPCTIDKCVQRKCAYVNQPNGASCSDGNACTQVDVCQVGRCVGESPVVCAPPNQCQTSLGCNASNGKCVYQSNAGSLCDDGNSCTQEDKCTTAVAGVCKGTRRPNGSTCDDGNSNTTGDVCTRGVCAGVICSGTSCPRIVVTPTAGLTTTESGGKATFTVALASQPTAAVDVSISSNDASEGAVTPALLSFTTSTWQTPQIVVVHGVNDGVSDGAQSFSVLVGPATSSDANYAGLTGPSVDVVNLDDDPAGIGVTPTSALMTSEQGLTATFTVVLLSQPTGDVSIPIVSSNVNEGVTSLTSLTFTAAHWNVLQTVTVRGVNDAVQDGDQPYVIHVGPATSSDGNYSGRSGLDVNVVNMDDDAAGLTINPATGLVTGENGMTATFTVVLKSQPAADVTVPIASSNTAEGMVSPSSMIFTAVNWAAPRTVTVRGVDDAIPIQDGDQLYTIHVGPTASGDPNYVGKVAPDISFINLDNDTAGLQVSPTTGLVTGENGATAMFTVVLNSQPTASVTVSITSSNTLEGVVSSAFLSFDANNWSTPMTVTVTGVDDAILDGNRAYSVTVGPTMSGDGNYDGRMGNDVAITNLDDEVPGN